MTTMDRFEAGLPDLFEELGRADASQLVLDVLAATAGARQRSRLLARLASATDRSDPRPLVRTLPTPVRIGLALILLLLTIAGAAVLVGGLPFHSTPQPARPLLGPSIPLLNGRLYGPTVVALPDGRVAIMGGGVAGVEVWDPSTGRSVAAGAISRPRAEIVAAPLSDGRVLVFGGFDANDDQQTRLTTAEIYDPATGTSVMTGDLGVFRQACHCGTQFRDTTTIEAIPLRDGRLLIVGGAAQSEIFDPTAGAFQAVVGGCNASRGAAARLRDGRVLVTCLEGFTRTEQGVDPGTNAAELFDPATGAFAPLASPTTTDSGAATVLADGRVLLTGEGLAKGVSPAELLDPASNSSVTVPGFNSNQPPLLLSDGRVLFSGAQDLPSGILDARTLTFTPVSIREVGDTVAISLADGRVLLVGVDQMHVLDVGQI